MQKKFLRVAKIPLFIVSVWVALSTSLQAVLETGKEDGAGNGVAVRKDLPPQQEKSFKTFARSMVAAAESRFKSLLGREPATKAPLRRIQSDVPPIAIGHEEIYRRFCKGIITCTNSQTNQTIKFPIGDLDNPLQGTVRSIGPISIHTGFWTETNEDEPAHLNVWIIPHFLIDETLKKSNWVEKIFSPGASAAHFESLMKKWDATKAPVGVFWTSGIGSMGDFEYLTTDSLSDLGKENLSEKRSKAQKMGEGYEALSRLLSQFSISFPEPE